MTNKIIDYAKRNGKECLLFKVDFSQAFDYVDWNYLQSILRKVGFGPRRLRRLEACVFSSSMSVLVNGIPTKDFEVLMGLHQGNPLSPFLFAIDVECLTIIMKHDVANGLFK